MKDDFWKKPVVPAIFVGVAACVIFYSSYLLRVPLLFVFLLFWGILLVRFFVSMQKLKRILLFLAIGSFVAFFALARLADFIRTPVSLLDLKQTKKVMLELRSEPRPASKFYAFDAKLLEVRDKNGNAFSANGNVKVFFPKAVIEQNLSGGISLVKEEGFSDAVFRDKTENIGTPCRVFASGVVLEAKGNYVKNEDSVDVFFAETSVPKFIRWDSEVSRFRGTLRFNLMRLLFSWGSAGALLLALISADKNFLASEVNNAFVSCGLAHVLALSGMHVSIVSGSSEKLFSRIFGTRLNSLISMLAICVFVWFAGAAPSLNRALGMALILILGKSLGVRISVFSAMSFMFLIHLLIKPNEAVALSFLLSYGALAGILTFGEALNTIGQGKVPDGILTSFSASFGAQAFTLPIIAFTIKRVTLIGLLSSSIVSPLIGWFLVMGLFFVFASMVVWNFAQIFGIILNWFYDVIMLIVNFFAGFFTFVIQDVFTAMLYVIVPIMFGLICVYFQNKILTRRRKLGNFSL